MTSTSWSRPVRSSESGAPVVPVFFFFFNGVMSHILRYERSQVQVVGWLTWAQVFILDPIGRAWEDPHRPVVVHRGRPFLTARLRSGAGDFVPALQVSFIIEGCGSSDAVWRRPVLCFFLPAGCASAYLGSPAMLMRRLPC